MPSPKRTRDRRSPNTQPPVTKGRRTRVVSRGGAWGWPLSKPAKPASVDEQISFWRAGPADLRGRAPALPAKKDAPDNPIAQNSASATDAPNNSSAQNTSSVASTPTDPTAQNTATGAVNSPAPTDNQRVSKNSSTQSATLADTLRGNEKDKKDFVYPALYAEYIRRLQEERIFFSTSAQPPPGSTMAAKQKWLMRVPPPKLAPPEEASTPLLQVFSKAELIELSAECRRWIKVEPGQVKYAAKSDPDTFVTWVDQGGKLYESIPSTIPMESDVQVIVDAWKEYSEALTRALSAGWLMGSKLKLPDATKSAIEKGMGVISTSLTPATTGSKLPKFPQLGGGTPKSPKRRSQAVGQTRKKAVTSTRSTMSQGGTKARKTVKKVARPAARRLATVR